MRLKEIRQSKGFTQKQVADYLGCNPCVYSRYENGEREPSIHTLILLSRFLGVTIDSIVDNDYTPEDGGLNPYEVELLKAAQGADDRARNDALTILRSNRNTKN